MWSTLCEHRQLNSSFHFDQTRTRYCFSSMMHLKVVFLIIMSYFGFVNASLEIPPASLETPLASLQNFDRNIPPENVSSSTTIIKSISSQNVSNNEEIKWNKTRNLTGTYDVNLLIFVKTRPQAGEVTLIVGEGDMINYTASIKTDPDDKNFHCFTINDIRIKIYDEQEIKLLYKGNRNLEIRDKPGSQITLTEINQLRPNNEDKTGVVNSANINNLFIWVILICVNFIWVILMTCEVF